jgi:hypothetical protein
MKKLNLFAVTALATMTSLLYAADPPSTASTKDYQGIYCLCNVQTTQASLPPLSGSILQSSTVSGFALRAYWSAIEPTKGVYNWSDFDQNLAIAEANNKNVSLSVTPGVVSPAWVISEGAKYINIAAGTTRANMPLPWDATYQKELSTFIQAEAARYDGDTNVSYVTMGGPGAGIETFLITNQTDYNTFAAAGGLPQWITGAEAIIDMYGSAFKKTPFVLAMGNPIQNVPSENAAGQSALEQVVAYGLAKYPGRFILATHGLSATSLKTNTANYWMYQLIMENSATSPVGFQMINAATNGPTYPANVSVGNLTTAVSNGIQMGAQFIEVYPSDCLNSAYTTMLQSSNATLRQN